jgi:hypothetical protein
LERQHNTDTHFVYPFSTLEDFGQDLLFDSDGSAFLLSLIVVIESVEKVEIGVQIHVLRAVERSPAKDIESETDTSSKSDLKVRMRTCISSDPLTIP